MVLYDQGDTDAFDDKGNFITPVAKKRDVKLTDVMKSPFVTEFGSSIEVLNKKKVLSVSKDLIPFSLKIEEPLRFDRQTEFNLWIKVSLKKKNKYVIVDVQFVYLMFYFCILILLYFSCRKKLYSDEDNLISHGFKFGGDIIIKKYGFIL